MTQPSAEEFFGSAPEACKFDAKGDTATGTVQRTEMRQQTDFTSGKLLFWPDGRPRMQAVVTLDIGDGEERNLYVRGKMQAAIREAIRDAKLTTLPEGSTLTVEYTGDEKPKVKGQNGAKIYKATVTAPEVPF